jgi:hypothetical protein
VQKTMDDAIRRLGLFTIAMAVRWKIEVTLLASLSRMKHHFHFETELFAQSLNSNQLRIKIIDGIKPAFLDVHGLFIFRPG